jgi:hypothetical protein
MKATEFVYWLQGYFEITGTTTTTLTPYQAQQVLQKAESVKDDGQSNADTQARDFVAYTKGVLFPVTQSIDDQKFLKAVSDNMQKKLNDLFIHAIDPAIPGDQQQHRQAHRPERPPGGGGIERLC